MEQDMQMQQYNALPGMATPQQQQQHRQQMQLFWQRQAQEIATVTDFKNHQLPLARIKKIMKSDEDVRMISAEAPALFAKACELFILELTLQSWIHTEDNKRRTLQKNDIAAAITKTDIFDFLVDIVPRDEIKEEGATMGRQATPTGAPADPLYQGMYYLQQGQQTMMPGTQQPMMMQPAMQMDPMMYHQQAQYMPQAQHMQYMPQQQPPPTVQGQASSQMENSGGQPGQNQSR
eukprot:jgi/Chlat1/8209/Chrsp76S09206